MWAAPFECFLVENVVCMLSSSYCSTPHLAMHARDNRPPRMFSSSFCSTPHLAMHAREDRPCMFGSSFCSTPHLAMHARESCPLHTRWKEMWRDDFVFGIGEGLVVEIWLLAEAFAHVDISRCSSKCSTEWSIWQVLTGFDFRSVIRYIQSQLESFLCRICFASIRVWIWFWNEFIAKVAVLALVCNFLVAIGTKFECLKDICEWHACLI